MLNFDKALKHISKFWGHYRVREQEFKDSKVQEFNSYVSKIEEILW